VSSGNIGQAKLGDAEHIHQLFVTNGGRGSDTSKTNSNQRPHIHWNGGAANYMRYPPAPLYTSDKSPMNGEMGFFPNANSLLSLHQAGASNDRIRNLRGRAPPGAQRLPMTHQLPPYYTHNLTSPMGAAPSKGTAWTPHVVQSPHRVVQPDPNSNSKRKCLPMKPPIPTKFQGYVSNSDPAVSQLSYSLLYHYLLLYSSVTWTRIRTPICLNLPILSTFQTP
jgi:hypothetical protein